MAKRKTAEPVPDPEQLPRRIRRVMYAPGLNLREAPALTGKVLRVLKCGETVTERDEAAPDGWTAVDGGFTMEKYLD